MVLLKIGVYARVETRGGGGGGCILPQAGLYGYSFGNRIQSTPSKIETLGTDTKCPF